MTTVILVDDYDTSRIDYHPDWMSGGDPTREYNGTTHFISSKGGMFSFAFNGTRVSVYGTIAQDSSSVAFECSLDGVVIDVSGTTTSPVNETLYQQPFCEGHVSDDTEHLLILSLTENSAHPFFLDYILYEIPLNSSHNATPLQTAGVVIAVDDRATSQVSYEGEWGLLGGFPEFNASTHGTTSSGARALFEFNGTKVAVYGTVAWNLDDHWTTTYQVDNGPPTTLDSIEYSVPWANALHQIKFFESMDMDDDHHTLIVTYVSGPLEYYIDFFTYTPSTSFGIDSTGTGSSPPSNSVGSSASAGVSPTKSIASPHSGSSLSGGGIAGAAVGGVVIAVLLALIGLMLRRRKKRRDLIQPLSLQPTETLSQSYIQQDQSESLTMSSFRPTSHPPALSNHYANSRENAATDGIHLMEDSQSPSSWRTITSGGYRDAGISLAGGPVRYEGAGGPTEQPPGYSKR